MRSKRCAVQNQGITLMQPQSKQCNFIESMNAKENNVIQCTVL